MAKSIKQLQAEVLAFLDQLGQDKSFFEKATKLNSLEYYLTISAANFVLKVQENLEAQGKVDTGALSDELEQSAVIRNGNQLSIDIGYPKGSPASKYYDFVNKGVQGYDNSVSKNSTSPYKFKKILNKKGGILIGKKMQQNIFDWIKRNNIKGDVAITKRQAKRQSLSKMVSQANNQKSLAYAVAVNIKKKGLKKTGYFDNAIQYSFNDQFISSVSKIIGKEITLNIKAIQLNGNNNK